MKSTSGSQDLDWCLGGQQRHRGSLHPGRMEGTAADPNSRGFIAGLSICRLVAHAPALERYDYRYGLVVSLRTDQVEVDLYNVIAQKVAIQV